jgi:hypothetical protein
MEISIIEQGAFARFGGPGWLGLFVELGLKLLKFLGEAAESNNVPVANLSRENLVWKQAGVRGGTE